LHAVLSDLATIQGLNRETSLWIRHYTARVLQLEGKIVEAEGAFDEVCSLAPDGTRLQQYAHCGLAGILTRWDRLGNEAARAQALKVADVARGDGNLDPYLANALFFTARVKASEADWVSAVRYVEQAQKVFEDARHSWGIIRALNELQSAAVLRGDWNALLTSQDAAIALLKPPFANVYLRARALGYWSWGLTFVGRCRRAETQSRESETIANKLQDVASACIYARNLGWSLAMQQKHAEGIAALRRSIALSERLGRGFVEIQATSNAILGMVLTDSGEYEEAHERLDRALRDKEEVGDVLGMADTLTWRGHLAMAKGDHREAMQRYQQSLEWKWTGRRYCESEARLAVCKALYELGRFSELGDALREAEAIGFAYHDHMACLQALRGHLLLNDQGSRKRANAVSKAYSAALVHGIQHNRFVLDRVTEAICRRCREDKTHGPAILEQLDTFWRTAVGATTYGREHGHEEGSSVPLINLEKRARAEEPGDGRRQPTVLDVLGSCH
jgi:tetratricopeptide (TPR) repeat protein